MESWGSGELLGRIWEGLVVCVVGNFEEGGVGFLGWNSGGVGVILDWFKVGKGGEGLLGVG